MNKPVNKRTHVIVWSVLEIGIIALLTLFTGMVFLKVRENVIQGRLDQFDITIIHSLNQHHSPSMTTVMKTTSFMGNEAIIILGIILVILLITKKHSHEALVLTLMVTSAFLISTVLKSQTLRPRPSLEQLVVVYDSSFPSGHALNAFIFYSLLAYFTYKFTHSRKWTVLASLCAGMLILLIGFSRMYLGVHYPSDIVAGYLIGFFWLGEFFLIKRSLTLYKLFKEDGGS
jgi:undecaprenyl-diphosphatase